MTGASRPREDRIRNLAKLLRVDDVWLALGRAPTDAIAPAPHGADSANGVALVVAGLIELCGGKVTFSGQAPTTLRANIGGSDLEIVAVPPRGNGTKVTFLVPEPVNDARVVAVIPGCLLGGSGKHLEVLDLSAIPRQHFGGYSVLELERAKDGALRLAGELVTVKPLDTISALVSVSRMS